MSKSTDDNKFVELPVPPDFRALGGICLKDEVDGDLFHPDKDSEQRLGIKVAKQLELAIAICNSGADDGSPCPAKLKCKLYGIRLAQVLGDRAWGIFGGQDIRELRKTRKAS